MYLVYILQNRVKQGIVYFFLTDYIQSNFVFNIQVPRQYVYFFDQGRIRISVFYMREHMELCIYSKTKQNKALYSFSYRVYSEPFLLIVGVPRYYLDSFRFPKIRISIFYIREHIELLYILQNRVEQGIVFFSERLYLEQFCFYHWGA